MTRESLIVKATVALAAAIDGKRLHSASATTIEPAPCSARLTLIAADVPSARSPHQGA